MNNNTSSLETLGIPSPVDLNIKGENRVIAVMVKELKDLKQVVHELKKERILKDTQLPEEVLENVGFSFKEPTTLKRGRGYRPILRSEILEAKEHYKTEHGAARYLKVSYPTYKKYAKLYGLWDPKPCLRDKKNIYSSESGKFPLKKILNGEFPDYPAYAIKDKLIRGNFKDPKCEMCGFSERRVSDGKVPLILNFLDGNEKNHKLDNLKIYCYNCTFLAGRGYIRNGVKTFDPDWIQGARKHFYTSKTRF
jgi:hypothetical protein